MAGRILNSHKLVSVLCKIRLYNCPLNLALQEFIGNVDKFTKDIKTDFLIQDFSN